MPEELESIAVDSSPSLWAVPAVVFFFSMLIFLLQEAPSEAVEKQTKTGSFSRTLNLSDYSRWCVRSDLKLCRLWTCEAWPTRIYNLIGLLFVLRKEAVKAQT